MSIVTVYAYKFYCDEQGALIRADPYATLDFIRRQNWEPILSLSLQVDSSKVIDERYHPSTDATT
jgi:hypothetical protein